MKDCIFCKIVNGEIPSKKVYEDDKLYVFLDLNQDCPGHCLIVPKVHYINLCDIPTDLLNYVMQTAIKLYGFIEEKLNCDGMTLLQNNGCAQDIKHFHLHLLPKYITKPNLSIDEVYDMLTKK